MVSMPSATGNCLRSNRNRLPRFYFKCVTSNAAAFLKTIKLNIPISQRMKRMKIQTTIATAETEGGDRVKKRQQTVWQVYRYVTRNFIKENKTQMN